MTQAASSPLNTPQYPLNGRFAACLKAVLAAEGGYVNDPADPGGATKFGISLRFAKANGDLDLDANGHADLDLDFDGDIDGQDIRSLTPEAAGNLYYLKFWRSLDLDNVPQHIDHALFDLAVNGGLASAVKILQRALNRMDLAPGDLTDDGKFGRITRARLFTAKRKSDVATLLVLMRQEARRRYEAIVHAKPRLARFLKGWTARAERLGDV